MALVIVALCILFTLLPVPPGCDAVQTPVVSIEMSQAGFHRDLIYTVQFDYPLAGQECEYILEQPLPAAVYVSVDQLDDLTRLKKLNAIYPKFVDIEVPTDKAAAFTVLLKGEPKITDSLKLPIHFRYHAPSTTSTFAMVDINPPRMYIRCPDEDSNLVDNELHTVPSAKYCLHEQTQSLLLHTTDGSSSASADACNWKLINVNYELKLPLRAKIPVGNEKSFPPILYATIVVSWIVSLWTVFRTHNVPRRINQKLEEQRILQKKMK